MEPRPATRFKENVPPKTVTVLGPADCPQIQSPRYTLVPAADSPPSGSLLSLLIHALCGQASVKPHDHLAPRPLGLEFPQGYELKRSWRSLDISLGSRGGRRMSKCQATIRSQDSVLCQKAYQVQSNLTSPCPRLALALKDTTGQLGDTGLWQQSNLQLSAGRSQARTREPFAQQSNLCFQGTTSPHPRNSCLSPPGASFYQRQTPQATDTQCLDLRLSGGLAPLNGYTWPDHRPWCGSGSGAPRLVGEPLTLEDLSVSAHSRSWVSSRSSHSSNHWLLDPIQHLEPENKAQSVGASDPQAACRKLLSRSFRAWRHLSQRHQAAAKAEALSHRQLIRKSLRVLRWVLRLREARLEAAWEQCAEALLAWSFQEGRGVALQQKQGLPHTQAAAPFFASRGSPSLGREAATGLAWKCRCFRAWQRFVQRGAQCRRHLAHRRLRVLRICLGQWMEMKQLQASDVTKVTQLALYRRKAGEQSGDKALSILVPGTATSYSLETVVQAQQLPRKPDGCSLWEACQRLALHRVLMLWRTRLYQLQQALSFFQGMQKRALQHILRQWRLRVWGLDSPLNTMETVLALEPWGNSQRGEAWLGCRASGCSLEKVQVLQTGGAVRLYRRTLQRRVLPEATGLQLEGLGQSQLGSEPRAVMGVVAAAGAVVGSAEESQEQGQGLVQVALSCWLSCWQRLYYFQAWCERVRDLGVSQDQLQAFQDDLKGALGATPASSQAACRAGPQAQDPCMAQGSVLGRRSFSQECGADQQLRRAQAQQAFVVWRVALGQYPEAQQQAGRRAQVLSPGQVAPCWVLWMDDSYLGQVHQAHAAQQLATRSTAAGHRLYTMCCVARHGGTAEAYREPHPVF
ncbi:uncharacterized protein C1orf167 homolog [Phodopus roborovskii]|uniref:uncharacterized protein C1orf167 homolog n=1 Tax=Phodopus roborovskii TaxID=109678 RepID=UPI0021E4A06D|nr:uncharacterized protein C1orf167 homolog [Phodopus roborovskii]